MQKDISNVNNESNITFDTHKYGVDAARANKLINYILKKFEGNIEQARCCIDKLIKDIKHEIELYILASNSKNIYIDKININDVEGMKHLHEKMSIARIIAVEMGYNPDKNYIVSIDYKTNNGYKLGYIDIQKERTKLEPNEQFSTKKYGLDAAKANNFLNCLRDKNKHDPSTVEDYINGLILDYEANIFLSIEIGGRDKINVSRAPKNDSDENKILEGKMSLTKILATEMGYSEKLNYVLKPNLEPIGEYIYGSIDIIRTLEKQDKYEKISSCFNDINHKLQSIFNRYKKIKTR